MWLQNSAQGICIAHNAAVMPKPCNGNTKVASRRSDFGSSSGLADPHPQIPVEIDVDSLAPASAAIPLESADLRALAYASQVALNLP